MNAPSSPATDGEPGYNKALEMAPFLFAVRVPSQREILEATIPRNPHLSWWTVGGSNPRPPHCERGALPAELTAHFCLASARTPARLKLSPMLPALSNKTGA